MELVRLNRRVSFCAATNGGRYMDNKGENAMPNIISLDGLHRLKDEVKISGIKKLIGASHT